MARKVGQKLKQKLNSSDNQKQRNCEDLETVKKDYDYILIDCPPTLGMLTVNAIAAADEIMIPVQTECLSAVDMTCLLKTVEEIKVNMKPEL
ncbi:MAG: AAA family ATPase [Solobacterium sp.]|nr:AAA family ATPase [Solobacterium sp.]MCH4073815.1 AAA family ATPase [Solobacterium sp.]